jgi:hypothetical protein
VAALSNGTDIMICDGETLEVVKVINNPFNGKDTIQEIRFTGRKSIVMYSYSNKVGRIMLWNITPLVSKFTSRRN